MKLRHVPQGNSIIYIKIGKALIRITGLAAALIALGVSAAIAWLAHG
jgi:hypothetical protein